MKIIRLLPLGLLVVFYATPAFCQQPSLSGVGSESEAVSPKGSVTRDGLAQALINAEHDPQYGLHLFPKRGGKLDWGLALSGGGLRSAAFSLGAMKALYDKKMMGDVDVISSASGGGYISYWAFTNYAQDKTQAFGDGAFRNDKFIQNVCELQTVGQSNLVKNKRYVQILSTKLIGRREQAFRNYQQAIENSFGNKTSTDTPLSFLHEERTNAPYFIINTTVAIDDRDKEKRPALGNKSSQVFEISPHFRGNPEIGFIDWTKEDKGNPSLSKAIAMSGAPHLFGPFGIEGKIKNFHDAIAGKDLTLTDGGHSENLAALALIRRGIKKVIIVDAEADPAYKFDSYLNLKKILDEMKINFCVPDIEWFLGTQCNVAEIGISPQGGSRKIFSPKAISEGKAKGANGSIDTHIYYIKMSLPNAVLPEIFLEVDEHEKKCNRITDGQKLESERQCQLCPDAKLVPHRPCRQRQETYKRNCKEIRGCQNIDLKLGTEGRTYSALYANIVWSYSEYLNKPSFKNFPLWATTKTFNALGRACYFLTKPDFLKGKPREFCSMLSYTFPHVTTLDQSFYTDQIEAFVGLGYLQTMKMEKPRTQ